MNKEISSASILGGDGIPQTPAAAFNQVAFWEAVDRRQKVARVFLINMACMGFGMFTILLGNYLTTASGIGMLLSGLYTFFSGTVILNSHEMRVVRGFSARCVGLFVALMGFGLIADEPRLHPEGLRGEDSFALVRRMAMPGGIDLTKPDALGQLKEAGEIIDLRVENGNWTSFMKIISFSHEYYKELDAMAVLGHGHGFYLKGKFFDRKPLEGREFFFGEAYEPCDNYLFSRHPLGSSKFVLYLLNSQTSREFTDRGLVMLFLRVLGPHWNEYVQLSQGRESRGLLRPRK